MTVASHPVVDAWRDRILAAGAARQTLELRGHGSKAFYGGPVAACAVVLDTTALAGVSSYEPTELVVTVRTGTPLAELEALLAERGQCLPFEPPRFAIETSEGRRACGTVGGMVAAGLAGPSRAAVGGLRDYLLGATLLDGHGELLSFGGQVMKNVAGYDVSRLLAGSMGVLGVICEVSLKVLPQAQATLTLRQELNAATAIHRLNEWAGQPLPLNASAWWGGTLVLRLSGATAAVQAAHARLGGEVIPEPLASTFWRGMRDHDDEFFVAANMAVQAGSGAGLWRLALPPTTPPLDLPGEQLIEWGGGQRWLCSPLPSQAMRDAAQAAGGHATLFRGGDKSAGAFAPLKPPLDRIHARLKSQFDPHGVFNPGRLVAGL
ncbi:MAG: glycolate oxidase subunit GlcE [Rubrivivax sp.]|jgi:glycolate oxidase FAD binding subunit